METELIRENMVLIGRAIEKMDELSDKITEARWNYELLKRKPELGQSGDPRQPTIRPETLFENITHLEAQKAAAVEILLAFTKKATVQESREAYLAMLVFYQRLGALTELRQQIEAGASVEPEKVAEITHGNTLPDAIEIAKQNLAAVTLLVDAPQQRLIEPASSLSLS